VRGTGHALDAAGYAQLARPTKAVPPTTYGSAAPALFERIIDQTVSGAERTGSGAAGNSPVQQAGG
jgi:hypothetical protein